MGARTVILSMATRVQYLNNINCTNIGFRIYTGVVLGHEGFRADARLARSQWETSLLGNVVSHWLGENLDSALGVDMHSLHTAVFCFVVVKNGWILPIYFKVASVALGQSIQLPQGGWHNPEEYRQMVHMNPP